MTTSLLINPSCHAPQLYMELWLRECSALQECRQEMSWQYPVSFLHRATCFLIIRYVLSPDDIPVVWLPSLNAFCSAPQKAIALTECTLFWQTLWRVCHRQQQLTATGQQDRRRRGCWSWRLETRRRHDTEHMRDRSWSVDNMYWWPPRVTCCVDNKDGRRQCRYVSTLMGSTSSLLELSHVTREDVANGWQSPVDSERIPIHRSQKVRIYYGSGTVGHTANQWRHTRSAC